MFVMVAAVASGGGVGTGGGQQSCPRRQQHESDGHVHQEDRTPSGARDVGAGQDPAEDLTGDRRAGEHGGVDAEGLGAGGAVASWRRSCVARASASPPMTWVLPQGYDGALPVCAARRSPCWPEWG